MAPTPQFASELDSVGYENLLNLENISIGWASSNDELLQTLNSLNVGTYTLVLNFVVETITNNTNKNIFGAILINSHLNIDCRTTISTALKIGEVYTSKRVIEITKDNKGKFTVAYLYGAGNDDVGETAKTTTRNCMLISGSQPRDYVPYGKYGIKIKTQCKNVYNATFNKTTSTGITRFADTQKLYLNGTPESENRFMLGSTKIPAGTYTLCLQLDSGKIADTAFFIYINNTWTTIASLRLNEQNGFKNHTTFTLVQEAEISLAAYMSTYQTCENAYVKYQVVEGSNADYVFEPYQEPGYTFVTLNGPLRSIPNGVKDMMYIKNNRLYVDRKISNIVLNGTQGCALYTFSGMNGVSIGSVLPTNMARVSGMCSRSTKVGEHYSSNSIWCGVNSRHIYWIGILDELGLSTAAELKTWLSTNNTEIIYESPEVVTEDYGEIELPVTYKTTTHITTDDTPHQIEFEE